MDDNNTPATRGDRQEFRTKVDGLPTDPIETIEILRGEVNRTHRNLVERIDDMQTKIVSAINGFTQSIR